MKNAFYLLLTLLSGASLFAKGIEEAENYHLQSNLQWGWAIESIGRFAFHGDEKVLDIGCGDGKITARIAEKLPNGSIIGVDVSPQMIDFANRRFADEKLQNLTFQVMDASALSFNEEFDIITCFCVLPWISDQVAALRKIREALVPGGNALLVMAAAAPNNISPQTDNLAKSAKWASYFPHFQQQRFYFTSKEYEIFLKEVGLEPLWIHESKTETPFENKEALIEWLRPLITFTKHLSVEKQEEFLADLAGQMLEVDPPAQDGSIKIHHTKMEMVVRKPISKSE